MMKRILFTLYVFLLMTLNLFSAEPVLKADFWLIPETGGEFQQERKTYSLEDLYRKILSEAQYVFSGLLYGFSFTYVPQDNARNVNEKFVLSPLHQIEMGDPALKTTETWRDKQKQFITLEYYLAPHQREYLEAWDSNTIPTVRGVGTGSLYAGYRGKITSMEEAVKNGVREYLRARHYQKPKEIKGEIVFWDDPQLIPTAGTYKSEIDFKLLVLDIKKYVSY